MLKNNVSRRGGVLIEPYKQLRFGVMFLVINLIFSLLVFAVFGYYLWEIYETLSVYFKLDESQSIITLAKLGQPAMIGVVLIILFIGVTLAVSARYTHQIYGPMVSIRRFLDELIAGKKPKPLNLRVSDQFQELAEKLNTIANICSGESAGINGESEQKVLASLNLLMKGEAAPSIDVSQQDPLYSIAMKLNELAERKSPS